jgi:glucosylceramidase
MKKWIVSTENNQWYESEAVSSNDGEALVIGEAVGKPLYGFGCCISELGVKAIFSLPKEKQNDIFDLLFGEENCGFNFCRLPIGANDFAEGWYSYNEHEGDYEMAHFSIDRDKKYIIPAIREVQKRSAKLRFFASPWSPPTWMKYPAVYNYGKFIEEEKNQQAYALYFKKYLEAYFTEGINVTQVHVQNEIHANQKFPSCVWSGEALANFIVKYLYPEIGDMTEIWFGTINGPEKDTETRHRQFLSRAMQVEGFGEAISGASYQWAGKFGITQAQEDYPELNTINSEMECGNGSNTWEYAMYSYEMMHHYFKHGARACVYWNMALPKDSFSTWGWKQNSLISVDNGEYVLTPEFYLIRHFAQYVKEGAVMLSTKGEMSSNSTVFRNPDGSRVGIFLNPFPFEKILTVEGKNYILPPRSFHTILL